MLKEKVILEALLFLNSLKHKQTPKQTKTPTYLIKYTLPERIAVAVLAACS